MGRAWGGLRGLGEVKEEEGATYAPGCLLLEHLEGERGDFLRGEHGRRGGTGAGEGGREATCAVKVREFKLGVDRWPRDGYHVGYNDTLH